MALLTDKFWYEDIDWFAVDMAGHVLQFSSSGGSVPISVDFDDNFKLLEYFLQLPDINGQERLVNPNSGRYKKFYSVDDLNTYLEWPAKMTQKGIFSFDKAVPNSSGDPIYFLVSMPSQPLILPDEIKNKIITRVNLAVDLNQDIIDLTKHINS